MFSEDLKLSLELDVSSGVILLRYRSASQPAAKGNDTR